MTRSDNKIKDNKVVQGEIIFANAIIEAFKEQCPVPHKIFTALADNTKAVNDCLSCPLNGNCLKQYAGTLA